mgnify:CR=1 FL=1
MIENRDDPRVATEEEVRAFVVGMDDMQGRCDAASAGPWVAHENRNGWIVTSETVANPHQGHGITIATLLLRDACKPRVLAGPANAALIGYARTDLPAALAVIRAQQAAMAEIVAARKAVWESVEGTTEGYAAHDRLRAAIAAAAAMLPTTVAERETT